MARPPASGSGTEPGQNGPGQNLSPGHHNSGRHDSGGEDGIVEIFTDGSCIDNPGPGGWGAVLRWRGAEKELSGGEASTTNNRMELTAAIEALRALNRPSWVHIHTDSTYLRNGITRWLAGWKRNGWRTKGRTPVKNVDLWQALEAAATGHEVEWFWVKGHSGHPGNERADALARAAVPNTR